jgi:insertion element IS1 protein InsB
VLDAVVGGRDEATGAPLFAALTRHRVERVCTDYYAAYRTLVPMQLHYRSKAGTTLGESCNSLLRHHLARFRRRTKCYSKCPRMLLQAVLLLRAKINGTLSMLM